MRKLYIVSTLVLAALFSQLNSYAQDFSNKGKDFWITSGWHYGMGTGSPPVMTLSLTSDVNTTYSIEAFGVGVITSGNIIANQVTIVNIPSTYFTYIPATGAGNGLFIGKAIHVTAVKPIVIYSFTTQSLSSAATLCLPTNVLGKQYYAASYTQLSGNSTGNNFITIIAVEDKTTIEIIPTQSTVGGWAPNSVNTINLNKGEIYQVLGTMTGGSGSDLTGTSVRSIASASGGCKRIAVFSGSGRLWLGAGCSNGADNLYQQLYPASTWGRKYLTVPSSGRPTNYYRIIRPAGATAANVILNGTLIPSASFVNNFYEFNNTIPNLIEADTSICVAQYFTSAGCIPGNGNPYDPDMVILNPVEQNISDVTLISSDRLNHTPTTPQHYIHVIMRNGGTGISSFRFDGGAIPPTSAWIPHPRDPNYSYLYLNNVSETYHSLKSDSGFNAIAYGYANYETYAYSAGTNVKDLYQQIGVSTQYGIEPTPAVCKGSPFKFKVSLPYCTDSIRWDLTNLPGPPVAPPTSIYTNCTPGVGGPDSTTVVNGVTLYWYSLPTTYTFVTSGTFPVTITTYAPNTNGCGSEQDIDFELSVYDPPVADFNIVIGGCVAEPTLFTDNTTTPRPSYIWNWDFGDPGSGASNTSGIKNPSHIFSTPGTYIVKFSTITTPGCVSTEITKQVTVAPIPTATITGAATVCINDPQPQITFTAKDGTAPYTFSYHINAGPAIHLASPTNTITVSVPTGIAGPFRYQLDSVKNTGSNLCKTIYASSYVDITVNANTGLAITSGSNTQAVCQNIAIANVVYAISGGGNNATATGLPVGVTGVYSAGTFSISGTPTTPGTYNYTVTATGLCLPNSLSGTITVNPDAAISLTTANNIQEVCINSPITSISYTISGGGTGGTVSGLPAGVSGVYSGGGFTISGTPTASGTFNFTVTTTGSCLQKTATGTILVNPLPTRNFTTNTPTCETRDIQFTDASLANAGVLNNWQWNFGDPGSGAANTSALQNPTHNYANVGTYNVSLTVTTDKGCVSTGPSIPVTIERRPLAGFSFPEVCFGDPFVPFTDTSKIASPDNVSVWNWNFGDPPSGVANTSALQNPQHTYPAVGAYNIELIAISNKGCRDTIVNSLFINGSNPTANFNVLSPTTLCSSDTIMISEASSVLPGTITKVEIYWDNVNQPAVFDIDDVPVTGKIYKHKYPTTPVTRTYTIRYRAYSGGLCVNDKFTPITVNGTPVVQFNNIPAACYDAAPFQITQASEVGGVAGTAVYSGPGVSSSGIFNPVAAGIGTFTIKYVYTATAGGCLDSMSKSITVLDTASARFSYSPTVCEKAAISFNSSTSTIPAASGTITGWNWDFGDPASGASNTSTLENPTHTFSTWGNYNVTLNVTTSNGCRSTTNKKSVFVNPIPVPDFSFPPSVCLPSANVVFTNASSIPDGTASTFTYLWDFGDPASGGANSSTGSGPSHIYNAVGPYNVNLQVTSGAGCVLAKTKALNIIHPQPTGSFTVDRDNICIGESFSFTDNSNPADGTAATWEWTMGDGNTRSVPTFNYTYGSAGEFDVNLVITNSNGCRSTVSTKKVTVNAYPVVSAGPDLFILEGGSDTLNAVVTANNPSYLWTPNTYFISSNTIKNPIVKGVQDITYTLTVTGRGNCVVSDQVFIKVLKGPEIPNIFSPNGDGVHDSWMIKYLDTYPESTVDIFNRYGQSIYHSVGYGVPWDGTINGKPVPIGTYYYIVNPKNGRAIITGYVDVIR